MPLHPALSTPAKFDTETGSDVQKGTVQSLRLFGLNRAP